MKKYILLLLVPVVFLVYCGGGEKGGEAKQAAGNVIAGQGKVIAVMEDMKAIGGAVMSYLTDNGAAPEAESIQELKDRLQPDHIRSMPVNDIWGNNFYYKYRDDSFWLASAGPDGKFEDFKKQGDDIVYQDGNFL